MMVDMLTIPSYPSIKFLYERNEMFKTCAVDVEVRHGTRSDPEALSPQLPSVHLRQFTRDASAPRLASPRLASPRVARLPTQRLALQIRHAI